MIAPGVIAVVRGHSASVDRFRAGDETVRQIQSGEIDASSDDNHTIIEYPYGVGGIRYPSDRVDFAIHRWSSGHRKSAPAAADQYTTGTRMQCGHAQRNANSESRGGGRRNLTITRSVGQNPSGQESDLGERPYRNRGV